MINKHKLRRMGIGFLFFLGIVVLLSKHVFMTYAANNLVLACGLKSMGQGQVLTESTCRYTEELDDFEDASNSLNVMKTYQMLQENPSDLADLCYQEGCNCSLPLAQDPRTRQINFFLMLAVAKTGGDYQDIGTCPEHFPTSSYLHLVSKGHTPYANDELAPIISEMAYLINDGWTRPLWAALNATDQAERYQAQGMQEEAKAAYERAIENLTLENGDYVPSYQATAYRGLANTMLADEDFALAVANFEKSILVYPVVAKESLPNYIKALQGSNVQMANHLQSFMSQNNLLSAEFVFNVVVALARIEKTDAAKLLLEMNDSLDSSYWLAANGAVSRAENHFPESETFFEQAISNSSEIDSSIVADWAVRLAIVRILQDDMEGGIESQELAVKLAPDKPYYWYDLATFYLAQSKKELAQNAIDQAVKLNPENEDFTALKERIQNTP